MRFLCRNRDDSVCHRGGLIAYGLVQAEYEDVSSASPTQPQMELARTDAQLLEDHFVAQNIPEVVLLNETRLSFAIFALRENWQMPLVVTLPLLTGRVTAGEQGP